MPVSVPALYPLCWRLNLINQVRHETKRAVELWRDVKDAPCLFWLYSIQAFITILYLLYYKHKTFAYVSESYEPYESYVNNTLVNLVNFKSLLLNIGH